MPSRGRITLLLLASCSVWRPPPASEPAREPARAPAREAQPALVEAEPVPAAIPIAAEVPRVVAPQVAASGLSIRDSAIGTGPTASAGWTVRLEYALRLTDGTPLDSTSDPGRSAFEFTLGENRVIEGWELGMVGVRAGTRRELIVPPELGYKDRSVGPIPANSVLVFDIEVLEIRPPLLPRGAPSAFQGVAVRDWVTADGVSVEVIAEGTGAATGAGSDVVLTYRGILDDGTVFDTTESRGPLRVKLGRGRLIPGWESGIAGMRVGELRRIRIPPAAAYGSTARGNIPGGSHLTFELELLDASAGP